MDFKSKFPEQILAGKEKHLGSIYGNFLPQSLNCNVDTLAHLPYILHISASPFSHPNHPPWQLTG